jgi:hypothetical protein
VKLRKQTGLKAAVVAGTAALMLALFSLVRSNPPAGEALEEPAPATNYEGFFAPNASSTASETPVEAAPRTRTRAS